MSGEDVRNAPSECNAAELGALRTAEDLHLFLEQRPELVSPAVVEQLGDMVRQRLRIDVDEALRLAESAVAIAERLQDRPSLGRSYRATANALWFKGNCKAAVALFDKAIAEFDAMGMAAEVGRTLSSSIQPLTLLGEYRRASAAGDRARQIFQTLGDEWRRARLDLNLANIHHRQDRFADALALYERAYTELVSWKDSEGLGVALHNMAVCLIMLNDFERALGCYQRASELCRQNDMPLLEVQAEYNIAYLYFLRGDYDAAIKGLQQTRQRSQQTGDAYHEALCNLDEAEIYLELNLTDEAARLAEEASRRFSDLGLGFEIGRSLAGLAIATHRLKESNRALELLEEARSVFEREDNQGWLALIELYRAIILCELGNYAASRKLSRVAKERFQTLRLDRREIICDLLLARVSLAMGDPEAAQIGCRTALQRLKEMGATLLAFEAHVLLGHAEWMAGRPRPAYESYNEARSALETLRSSIQAEELKISFLQDKSSVYQNLVELCLDTGLEATETIFGYIEQGKSRALAERVFAPNTGIKLDKTAGARTGWIQTLRRELNWIYHRIELEQTARDAISADRVQALRAEARQKEDEFVRIIRESEGAAADAQICSASVTLDLPAVREALHPDAAIVEYFQTRAEFVAVVISGDGTHIVRLACLNEVNAHVRMLEFQLSKFRLRDSYSGAFQSELLASIRSRLQELYRDLVQPLAPLLRRRHLVVIPHGILHYVPFHALYDGTQYLIDQFTVSVAPSASIYTMCTQKAANSSGDALLLGVPDENAPFIEEEIRSVAAAVPESRVFLGANATTDVLRSAGPHSRLIHIASHGVFRKDNAMFSSVRLADSYVTLYDLYDLRLPVELLALSGCGTALNVVGAGDELLGLTRGLLSAGARSVLLSLWDVHDRTTAEFMAAFYTHLGTGREKASALQEAMLETRSRQPHPYFWAPFVLVGDALN
jgi:CHAT domain-containing protein